jgi:uncharacterized glyoxalase superfamily protein PhnB
MARKTKKKSSKPVKKAVATKRPAARAVAKPKTKAKTSVSSASVARGAVLVSVTPGFTVNDAEKSLAWYCDVLGFKVKERWEHEGRFLGAQLTSGSVTLNLGQDDWKMGRDRVKGQGTRMYIMTGPKIDQFADQIKARGGALDHEPKNDWGLRAFSITDPDGYKLTFMTTLKK